MNRILSYLRHHHFLGLGLAAAYFVSGAVYHEDVQDLVRLIQREAGWMWASLVLGSAGVAWWGWCVARKIGGRGSGKWIWGGLMAFSIAGYAVLMSYPTEVVHYLQFGLLSVGLAVVLRRIDAAFVLTTVAGMLDEAYQYWWLHRSWGVYYDFNDVLLNIIAAALGLATVATLWPEVLREESRGAPGRLGIDASLVFAITLLAAFAVGVLTGLIATQAADARQHTLLLLNRMPPFDSFWDTWGGTARRHHIVRPGWGALLTGLMTFGGVAMVKRLRYHA